jgi:hypothetical protein
VFKRPLVRTLLYYYYWFLVLTTPLTAIGATHRYYNDLTLTKTEISMAKNDHHTNEEPNQITDCKQSADLATLERDEELEQPTTTGRNI